MRRLAGAPGRPAARWHCPRPEQLEGRIVPVVFTPFNVRFTATVTGDLAILANTLETATTVGDTGRTQQGVRRGQRGQFGLGRRRCPVNQRYLFGQGEGRFLSSRDWRGFVLGALPRAHSLKGRVVWHTIAGSAW
jgi:hypothetical protein